MTHQINLGLPPKEKLINSLHSDPFCEYLVKQLQAVDHIDCLYLSGNSYSNVFFEELATHLQKMKRISKVIVADIFTTRKNEILPSLRALNHALQHKGLVLFDLSSNAICPDGCLEIVDIIKTNSTLEHLILDHVALSEAGTVTIAKSINEGNLSLRTLRVIKNRIENQAPFLGLALERQTNLEELIIFQNSIKNQSMTAF